jgi:nitrite reductase/ring-hydroxylating ferredoxin subunit
MTERTPPQRTPDGRPLQLAPRWRRDFPIEVERDDHVARRELVKFLILTSGALFLGQLWIGLLALRRGSPRYPRTRIARASDVPVGGALSFDYPGPGHACLLVRPDEHGLLAFGQKCTHLSCAVQPELDRGRLACPCHRGFFDASTGRPLAGPPRRPLPRIRLEVEGGEVYATGVELST